MFSHLYTNTVLTFPNLHRFDMETHASKDGKLNPFWSLLDPTSQTRNPQEYGIPVLPRLQHGFPPLTRYNIVLEIGTGACLGCVVFLVAFIFPTGFASKVNLIPLLPMPASRGIPSSARSMELMGMACNWSCFIKWWWCQICSEPMTLIDPPDQTWQRTK